MDLQSSNIDGSIDLDEVYPAILTRTTHDLNQQHPRSVYYPIYLSDIIHLSDPSSARSARSAVIDAIDDGKADTKCRLTV